MSSSSSIEREIDEYQDVSSGSEGSEDSVDSVDSSSCNDSSDEHYSSGVPGISLKEPNSTAECHYWRKQIDNAENVRDQI